MQTLEKDHAFTEALEELQSPAPQASESFLAYTERALTASGKNRQLRRQAKKNLFAMCRKAGIPINGTADAALAGFLAIGLLHGLTP